MVAFHQTEDADEPVPIVELLGPHVDRALQLRDCERFGCGRQGVEDQASELGVIALPVIDVNPIAIMPQVPGVVGVDEVTSDEVGFGGESLLLEPGDDVCGCRTGNSQLPRR
jgi:hypothetical protein